MRNASLFLLFALCLWSEKVKAQDSLLVSKNQIFAEVLGNNFFDINSSADVGYISLNYSRKLMFNRNNFMINFGIGPVRAEGYDSVNNTTYKKTVLGLSTGILYRYNYKRNGFWAGLFTSVVIGEISYLNYQTNGSYFHPIVFTISPNLTYQFQDKSENFFCRLTFSPKFFPSILSEKYGSDPTVYFFPLWGGISIGGGW